MDLKDNRDENENLDHSLKIPFIIQTDKLPYDTDSSFSAIRFYDNQEDIIKEFRKSKKYVESIQVSNEPNFDIMKNSPYAEWYTRKFLQKYPNNKYALHLEANGFIENKTSIGFSINEAISLKSWADSNISCKKIVIFDWDGTLSVVEGILLPESQEANMFFEINEITYPEIALYYSGSKNRLHYMKSLFNYLDTINVEFFILTNNPTAILNWKDFKDCPVGPESRSNFYKLAKEFIPTLKEENIICGYETFGDKLESFRRNNYLENIYCQIEKNYYLYFS